MKAVTVVSNIITWSSLGKVTPEGWTNEKSLSNILLMNVFSVWYYKLSKKKSMKFQFILKQLYHLKWHYNFDAYSTAAYFYDLIFPLFFSFLTLFSLFLPLLPHTLPHTPSSSTPPPLQAVLSYQSAPATTSTITSSKRWSLCFTWNVRVGENEGVTSRHVTLSTLWNATKGCLWISQVWKPWWSFISLIWSLLLGHLYTKIRYQNVYSTQLQSVQSVKDITIIKKKKVNDIVT